MKLLITVCLAAIELFSTVPAFGQWKMHVIDDSSRGADGVRLADFNGDNLLDIVTGWEEGGVIRVYQNPGAELVRSKWPAVTVGRVKSPEDAVFVDLDSNGVLDVVSCCEGKTKTVYVHWAPPNKSDYLDATSWKTEPFPATAGTQSWMFAVPAEIDGRHGTDLYVGAKGREACVGWLQAPPNPRRLADWKFFSIEQAGWIMSLRNVTWQGNSYLLVSDRKGPRRGVYFLQKAKQGDPSWKRVDVSRKPLEFMFLDWRIRSELLQTVVATRNGSLVQYSFQPKNGSVTSLKIPNPDGIRNGKAVAMGDIDLDGQIDFVHSCNTQGIAKKQKVAGVHWLKKDQGSYTAQPISSFRGKKFDRLELLDLDQDGDLDVLTCEEADNLGVIWFENPTRH